jgi:hypothetical protein
MHHLPIAARVFLGPAVAAILLCGGLATVLRAEPPPLAERFLLGDGIVSGVAALERHLAAHGDDDEARFGLGVLQFVPAVERLGQSLHHHGGLGGESGVARMFPLLRLPVPANPTPVETSYDDVRGMIKAFIADLAAAEKTLAAVRDENVALPLRFGLFRLDLDGDGKAGEAAAILAGRRLVPHWRLAPGHGINLRRVFLEPRPFDVVGWAQGAAAVPYVDKGECSSFETWRRLQRVFRGNFIGFAIWFN